MNRFRPATARSLLLGAALCAAACASNDVAILIDSDPDGATVYIDGERAGKAGETFTLHYGSDPMQQILIQLRKPSFKPIETSWEIDEVPPPGAGGARQWVFHLEPIQ